MGYGKIVQLSGGGATAPLAGLSAYAASKAAVVRFAETLAVELRDHRVDVNAIAPGALNTRMLERCSRPARRLSGRRSTIAPSSSSAPAECRSSAGPSWRSFWDPRRAMGSRAKLLSAVWDPWRELPEHREDLDSDVYTLRRIVPGDRGLGWGEV